MNTQQLTGKALASLDSDASKYEAMAQEFESTDADRAAACREFANIVRSWKQNSHIVSNRVRMM